MNNHFKTLEPLIKLKSNIADAEEFHAIVNVVFHDVEAKYYDKLHQDMWKSLPSQYRLLVDNIRPYLTNLRKIKLLDIGCGTGLATQMLLEAGTKELIGKITLLDTSPVMLNEAQKRSRKWGKETEIVNGEINALSGEFDMIIISSVLHHIPDLDSFLKKISDLQAKGGILITIHDPSSEAMHSDIYLDRCREFTEYQKQTKPALTLADRIINKLRRTFWPQNYLDKVNTILINKKVINEPLTGEEIWSVTDIHVEGLPYSKNDGVSKQMLTDALSAYQLINYSTYDFFGTPISNLTSLYLKKEQELSLKGDLNGRNFSSTWIKTK
ncbi:class I SAM-dependent methyltransferase [Mucilaginibacter litoreus]|uniref:Class I SAM-dependent methyltransferase n=1 Tax=Mucilaginibacter litoreus TaxID=1048221 RepID=A0ABW3AXD4_9SPHI